MYWPVAFAAGGQRVLAVAAPAADLDPHPLLQRLLAQVRAPRPTAMVTLTGACSGFTPISP